MLGQVHMLFGFGFFQSIGFNEEGVGFKNSSTNEVFTKFLEWIFADYTSFVRDRNSHEYMKSIESRSAAYMSGNGLLNCRKSFPQAIDYIYRERFCQCIAYTMTAVMLMITNMLHAA
jgi:hypothetical protein